MVASSVSMATYDARGRWLASNSWNPGGGAHPIAHVQDHGPSCLRASQQSCELANLDERRSMHCDRAKIPDVHTSSLGSAVRSP
jgi:hypothetical protein